MTIAEMIKKTRLDNNMTQEEYGNKFGVTRQTVSSWENEKSMPDLQMLITICNTYKISLDLLLNDDYRYVNKIDVMQKAGRILKRILPALCVLVCVYLTVFGVWKMNEKRENANFASRVMDLGFILQDGCYIMQDKDILYELPNQKLPFMRFEFYAQNIQAVYRAEDYNCRIYLNMRNEKYIFSIDHGIDTGIEGSISSDGIIEYEQLSDDDAVLLDECGENVEDILHKMINYYNAAYDL